MRLTEFENGQYGSEYLLDINPSSGEWGLKAITDPYGQYAEIQKGNLGVIEPGRWYELGIIVNENSIQAFWDDQLFLKQDNILLYGLINHFGLGNSAPEATLDVDNWQVWELDTTASMRTDWISSAPTTVEDDNFMEGEGWQSNPAENESFQDGRAVLFTDGGETSFSRDDLQGTNIAMEVTFSPRDMPDTASLMWFLGVDKAKEEFIAFEYFPATGFWQILEVEGQAWSPLASGWTQPTSQGVHASIMVAANGRRISAFHDDAFLGYADSSRSGSGTINYISLRSNGASLAQSDILKIGFWNLDYGGVDDG